MMIQQVVSLNSADVANLKFLKIYKNVFIISIDVTTGILNQKGVSLNQKKPYRYNFYLIVTNLGLYFLLVSVIEITYLLFREPEANSVNL